MTLRATDKLTGTSPDLRDAVRPFGVEATTLERPTQSTRNTGLWRRLQDYRLHKLAPAFALFLDRLIELLKIPEPGQSELLGRIRTMERNIVLPIKAAGILMLLQSLSLDS